MEISDDQARKLCKDPRLLTMHYTRTIKPDGGVRKCSCSCMIETDEWDYHQLVCGHYFHTRCLRAWLTVKGVLNCPLCGDLPETSESHYCVSCKEWGHRKWDDRVCPTHLKKVNDEKERVRNMVGYLTCYTERQIEREALW